MIVKNIVFYKVTRNKHLPNVATTHLTIDSAEATEDGSTVRLKNVIGEGINYETLSFGYIRSDYEIFAKIGESNTVLKVSILNTSKDALNRLGINFTVLKTFEKEFVEGEPFYWIT
ncbi:hypothetical protein [Priestia aryabhattai]|uniref:hypothetical protein n=1 Tax=Priestia aryabhattai TaxID=412384 RepID=UPI0015F738B7|nr:hypothetical protein [Priestia aryabhattai]